MGDELYWYVYIFFCRSHNINIHWILKKRKSGNNTIINRHQAHFNLPFTLPPLLFESFMDRLSNWWLHEINVAHNERRKNGLQLMMETTVLEIICKYITQDVKFYVHIWLHKNMKTHRRFLNNHWEFEIAEMSPRYRVVVQPKHVPYHTQTSTRTFRHVRPASH